MKSTLGSETMIEEVGGIFGALADTSRLRLLRVLLESETPLNQSSLVEAVGLSQANTSKHLACLVRMGLITRRPDGNTVYYSPVEPLVSSLCALVSAHACQRAQSTVNALS